MTYPPCWQLQLGLLELETHFLLSILYHSLLGIWSLYPWWSKNRHIYIRINHHICYHPGVRIRDFNDIPILMMICQEFPYSLYSRMTLYIYNTYIIQIHVWLIMIYTPSTNHNHYEISRRSQALRATSRHRPPPAATAMPGLSAHQRLHEPRSSSAPVGSWSAPERDGSL